MNSNAPFNADQDWTLAPYCQNNSNDQLVDKLIGNAYQVVRAVYANLGNLSNLYSFLNTLGMVVGVRTEEELKALSALVKYARVYEKKPDDTYEVTDYLYLFDDNSGIKPNDPLLTGSWVKIKNPVIITPGSGSGGYIPVVYKNGSATGGETYIKAPDDTVDVPFLIINGDMQTNGYQFEYNQEDSIATLAQPLEEGDFVVMLCSGLPASPDNPNVSDWVTINWLYNHGNAVGGEQVINIPYNFQSVPAIYVNGSRYYKDLSSKSYTVDSTNKRIFLTEPLLVNDRLIVQLGGEAKTLEVIYNSLQEVARATNVKDSEVILSTDTVQSLNNKKIIYNPVNQQIYAIPELPTNVYISSVVGNVLTYVPGNIQVTLLTPQEKIIDSLNDSMIAVKQPYPNSLSRTQHDKNLDALSVKDFATLDAAIVAAISSGTGLFDNTSVLSVTVGTNGQFQTINAALDFLALSRPKSLVNEGLCEINLLSGFTLREQILLDGGVDFGWVKITSEDETVLVDASAITVVFSELDSITPLFGATNGSILPTIATLFDYSDNTTAKDGVAVLNGSKVGFLPGSGVLHCRNGLKVLYASEAYCYMPGLTIGGGGSGALAQVGVSFRYALNRALHVAFGSRAGLARSDFRDSLGDVCVYVIWGSYVDLYQSSAKNSAGIAFHCRDGSGMNARQTEASYSLTGYHALHNSFINARSKSEVTEPGDPWSGEGAKGCRRYGVLASNNCVVEAVQLNVDNCTGSAGISATGASVVNFYDGSAQNCSIRGIWVQQGSTVNANTANVSNSVIGVEATEASIVSADNMVANTCNSFGLLATNGAIISAGNLTAIGCARAIEARQFATISATQGANLSGSTDRAVSAIDGGNIYCGSANCTNAGSRGITARNGARVSAIGCDVTNAGAYGVEVQNGSTVAFNSGIDTKGMSQAANTITANGIIFK